MKQFVEIPYEQRKVMGLSGRNRMETLFDKKQVVENSMLLLTITAYLSLDTGCCMQIVCNNIEPLHGADDLSF